jgi:hypothetical protein
MLLTRLRNIVRKRKERKTKALVLQNILLEQSMRRHPAKGVRHGIHD